MGKAIEEYELKLKEVMPHYKCPICGHMGDTYHEEPQPCNVCKITEGRTIWNSDGTDGPCLITF